MKQCNYKKRKLIKSIKTTGLPTDQALLISKIPKSNYRTVMKGG
jgi:hypothetical protein